MYKRRVKILLVFIALVLVLLIARIGQMQIVRGDRYRAEYERSMREVHLLPAARGQITDRNQKILAVDKPCKDFCLDYRFLTGDQKWSRRQVLAIQRAGGLSREDANEAFLARCEYTWKLADELARDANGGLNEAVTRIVDRVRRLRERMPQRPGAEPPRIREELQAHAVVPALSDDAAVRAEAEIQAGHTVGAVLLPGHKRYYPYGDIACHLIGLTGAVSPADLDRLNIFPADADWLEIKRDGYEPDDTLGISGIERACEGTLRGRRGYRIVDTGGRSEAELESEPAEGGGDVHTTIDVRLQEYAAKRLRESGRLGAAVVISIAQNDVLAMASIPTYDLNRYRLDYALLADDDFDLPLLNRAATGLYPPGSSIKPLAALAALGAGRITPGTQFTCEGALDPRNPLVWRCEGIHHTIDLTTAIMKSCNVYFYHVGEHATLPVLSEWYRQFGLADRCGTGLPEEKSGHVLDASWSDDPRNRNRLTSEAMQEAIGQGTLLVTPTHMANAMATLARDGRFMEPLLYLEGRPPRTVRNVPLPAGAAAVREGMRKVVGQQGGTAFKAFRAEPLGIEVAGKTGTAQAPPQRLEREHGDRGHPGQIVREGKMAWFIGYAPAEKPKIAFAVLLEYTEQAGGVEAAPVARDIIRYCRELGYLD